MTTFGTFDEQSRKKIATTVTRLKYQQQNIHKQLGHLTHRADQNALQVRTAVTGTTPDVPVYPTSGCQFPFTINDITFPDTLTDICDPTDKEEWTVHHIGRTIDGSFIPENTEILYVEVQTPLGHRFWILPTGAIGAIAFTLTTDRTRENIAGLYIGKAQADITDTIGSVPDPIGANVEVIFPDRRWLEAVIDCQGWALYIDGEYIVVECQGLPVAVWATTEEDRLPGAPEQDVFCNPVFSQGHAQDDLPIEERYPQPPPTGFKIRYAAGTFPRMVQGAQVLGVLDNQIKLENGAVDNIWWAWLSDQLTQRISFTAEQDICGTSTTTNASSNLDEFPNGQAIPLAQYPLAIGNPQTHACKTGESVHAEWSKSDQAWLIYDIEKIPLSVPINLSHQFNAQSGCWELAWQNQQMYIERCDDPVAGGLLQYNLNDVHHLSQIVYEAQEVGGSQPTCTPRDRYDLTKYTAMTICSPGTIDTKYRDWLLETMVTDIDWNGAQDDGCPENTETIVAIPGVCFTERTDRASCIDCEEESPTSEIP
jgi:hypothetical protein